MLNVFFDKSTFENKANTLSSKRREQIIHRCIVMSHKDVSCVFYIETRLHFKRWVYYIHLYSVIDFYCRFVLWNKLVTAFQIQKEKYSFGS